MTRENNSVVSAARVLGSELQYDTQRSFSLSAAGQLLDVCLEINVPPPKNSQKLASGIQEGENVVLSAVN